MRVDLSIVVLVWTVLFGLALGSFLNVVVLRLPLRGLSIVRPRSHCTACGATVRWHDNLPVLGWILLQGRCRSCGITFSGRYALVEAAMGLAAGLSFYGALWQGGPEPGLTLDLLPWVRACTGTGLFFGLAAVTLVDLDRRIIPDEITLPGLAAGVALSALFPRALHLAPGPYAAAAFTGEMHVDGALHALLGAAAGGAVVYALGAVFRALLGKEAMGLGDVKLLAMLGAFVGWDGALLALVLASLAGSAGGGLYYLVTRDRYIPFGPFLALGGLALFWGRGAVLAFFLETYPDWLSRVAG